MFIIKGLSPQFMLMSLTCPPWHWVLSFLSHHYHPWNYYRGFLQMRRSLYPIQYIFPCPDYHEFNIVRARLYCLKGYRSTSYLLYPRDIHPVECMVKCTISPQIYYFSTLKPNFMSKITMFQQKKDTQHSA